MEDSPRYGWSGRWPDLVTAEPTLLVHRLTEFLPESTPAQRDAWTEQIRVLQRQGAEVLSAQPHAREHSAVLEYALPREGGRRPDVLVLQNGRVVVLEFKSYGRLRRADLDQVHAYARDLAQYHTACEALAVVPMLVLCGAGAPECTVGRVQVVPGERLAAALVALSRDPLGPPVDVLQFLAGEYAPLPTLVAAARLLFHNLPLPFVRRAHSSGVHAAVERVLAVCAQARATGTRHLLLLTGVPGAGKTLVGLQVAHHAALEDGYRFGSRRVRGAPATFLSGNGPLVQVLQDALESKAFVQDMHRYIREYGLEHVDLVPRERVIVFDEAQRAWDHAKVTHFYTKKAPHIPPTRHRSEPRILIDIADRIDGWAVVLALVGEGQEIHSGEEGGLDEWVRAVAASPRGWSLHGPPRQAARFVAARLPYREDAALDLDRGLRAQAAEDYHRWVGAVLDHGDLATAATLARRLRDAGFPIYVTRDLDAAREYLRHRFWGETERRYGLLASSKAKNLGAYGLDPGFQATKHINIGAWFNHEPMSPKSCCALTEVVTEFQCQGLELDLPLVCWGDDLRWEELAWISRPARRSPLVRDPHRLRTNAYRVLLTRGREGLLIFVPPDPAMDTTAEALVRAGAVEVRTAVHAASA